MKERIYRDDPADSIGWLGVDEAILVKAVAVYENRMSRAGTANGRYIAGEIRHIYSCLYNQQQPVSREWLESFCPSDALK